MTIEPPTKSIANGHDLASDGSIAASAPEESITGTTPSSSASSEDEDELKRLRLQVLDCVQAEEDRQWAQQTHERDDTEEKTLTNAESITATAPSSSASSEDVDELKRLRLQVLDCVQVEEDRQVAQQSHERDDTEEKASYRHTPRQNQEQDDADKKASKQASDYATAPPSSRNASSILAGPPDLSRNPPARPTATVAMTARPVPQEYRRDKGVTQDQHDSEAGLPLRTPGAYPIRPTTHGVQEESAYDDDEDEVMTGTNNEPNEPALLSDDFESALEAQVAPERRDLNQEVQQKMEAITIDPIAVAKSGSNNTVNGPPSSQCNKFILPMIILLVLAAIGSTIGILASQNKEELTPTIAPTFAPTFVSDLELARTIFTPLSGNETLWDESSSQYKALWWIVHEDPAQMMTLMMQDETQSLSNMIVERYVMAVLYFSTDGPNWSGQTNFLSNSSICDWQDLVRNNRVICNDQGSVVKISICKCVGLLSAVNIRNPSPKNCVAIAFQTTMA
jgi:hypothetical protein